MKSRDSYDVFEVFKPGHMEGASFFQKFAYWFKNVFVPHFGLFTIIGIIIVVLLFTLVKDIVTSEHNDLDFILGGAVYADTEQMNALADYLGSFIEKEDGKEVLVGKQMLCTGSIFGSGDAALAFDEYAAASIDKITVSFADDEILLFLLDKKYAEWYKKEGAFEKLSTFGIESEDEYLVRIEDSEIIKELGIESNELYGAIKVITDGRRKKARIMEKYENAAAALLGIISGR